MPALPGDQSGTRERLLDAAGQVFADRGFANATVREICALAGANIAAVNYYFGDKQALYSQVLQHTLELARTQYPININPTAPAAERLRDFIRAFLRRILDQGRPAWHGRLMVREMVEPTAALDMMIETTVRPTWQLLLGIIAELTATAPTSESAKLGAMSVIGQCVMHKHCQPAISKLYPSEKHHPETVRMLADHITAFSLAGLKAIGPSPANS
ncbi:MAG: CerR family C-terminal domain-containing protein [Planctomycetes bacterium]|nr:CerR family C-terminal domain-containing protein [Planctomycetota bacterium]